MNIIAGRAGVGLAVAMVVLTLVPDLTAAGGKGGRGGGGGHPAAPHVSYRQPAPARNSYRPPNVSYRASMPRAATPRRMTAPKSNVRRPTNNANANAKNLNVKRTTPRSSPSSSSAARLNRTVPGSVMLPRTATRATSASRRYATSRSRYYGNRAGVRRSRGYGYSRRYAVANQNTRAVVQRLRSTHSSLARLDHDYQGHRVRAMRSIQRAIRQLSHTSMNGRNGYANRGGVNGVNGVNNRNGVNGLNRGGLAARGNRPIPQAQSDARMRRAGQTLQAVNMQLSRNSGTSSHAYARRYVQTAMREIGVALQVR